MSFFRLSEYVKVNFLPSSWYFCSVIINIPSGQLLMKAELFLFLYQPTRFIGITVVVEVVISAVQRLTSNCSGGGEAFP